MTSDRSLFATGQVVSRMRLSPTLPPAADEAHTDIADPGMTGPVAGRTLPRLSCRATVCLALLPVLDCVVNQLNTILAPRTESVSMLQVLRGSLVTIMTCVVLRSFYAIGLHDRAALVAGMLFIYSFAFYLCKEVLNTGSLELENVTHYVQIVYWLEVWLLATMAFDTPRRRHFALVCIVAGALMSSASIFYGYLTGTRLTYEYQQIAASTGLFNSGKGVAGVLVVSGIASAYLLRERANSIGVVIACLMFTAAFLTYARAGLVALCAELLTIGVWSLIRCPSAATTRWARRLLAGCVLLGVIGYLIIGTADLTARWADMMDPDQAGSGRITFWKVALDSFWDAGLSEQLLGRGYVGMYAVMQSGYGMRIHTHNDLLDMLLVGGVMGVVCLVIFWATLIARLRLLHVASAEYGAGLAILAGLFAQSLLTGQIFDPSTMAVYVIAFVCVTAVNFDENVPDICTYRPPRLMAREWPDAGLVAEEARFQEWVHWEAEDRAERENRIRD